MKLRWPRLRPHARHRRQGEHVVQVYPTQGWLCTCSMGGDPAPEDVSIDEAARHMLQNGLMPNIQDWPLPSVQHNRE